MWLEICGARRVKFHMRMCLRSAKDWMLVLTMGFVTVFKCVGIIRWHFLEEVWVRFYIKHDLCVKDLRIRSDVPCLEVPYIPFITACDEIMQETEPQGLDSGGEVIHTYSSVFQPPTHKILILPVPSLPDKIVYVYALCGTIWWGEEG
jgi:hypothetical protein